MNMPVNDPGAALQAKLLGWKNFGLKHLIGLIVVVLLFIGVIVGFSSYNGTRNHLVDDETRLNAQYQSNQVTLDKFHKKITEEFGLVSSKTAAVNTVLDGAVEGRYNGSLQAATPGTGQSKDLISALVEAYPTLDWANVYDKLVTEISAGRDEFANQQKALLDMIRPYDQFRQRGVLHHQFVKWIGYPDLQARIGTTVFTGKKAYDQMKLMVTSGEVNQDFTSGTENPLNLAPTTSAVPSPTTGG